MAPLPRLAHGPHEHQDVIELVDELLAQGRADDLRRLLRRPADQPVGPFKSEAAATAFLRDRLVGALKPRMVWLFGSRARGAARADSDFDLLVVLPDGLSERAYTHEAAAEPLIACGLAYDVVPCRWSAFLAARESGEGIVARVIREGRLLYADRGLRRSGRDG